jgi:cysteine-rich repeat protein
MLTRKPLFLACCACLPVLALAVGCDDNSQTTSTGATGGETSTSSSGKTTSSISSSSTGMGGLPNVDPADKCPGNLIELGLDQSIKLTGTTAGQNDDYHEFCADSDPATTSAPDVVYELKTSQYCSFSMDLVGSAGFVPAAELRAQGCADRNGGDECINSSSLSHLGKELVPGDYFIVVDGANKTSGDFTLTLSCKTPGCGDGIINSAEEQCDPGTPTPGDGCGDPGSTSACKFEATDAPDTCAEVSNTNGTIGIAKGQNVFVPAALPLFNTAAATDDYEGSCSYTNFSGPDQVFAIKPTSSGLMTVVIGRDYQGMDYCQPPNYDQAECWNSVAWIHEDDCSTDMTKELALANAPEGTQNMSTGFWDNGNLTCRWSTPADNNVLTIQANVTAGKTYYLFVEGDTPEGAQHSGPYLLNVVLQ